MIYVRSDKKSVEINLQVSEKFQNFINDWDYEMQLSIGGYGSGKSYSVAQKIILKLFQEKRKCLVVRNVYDTIKESCFDLFLEILENMNMISENIKKGKAQDQKVIKKLSPLEFVFPNGGNIIFKGLDNEEKIKSINNVSIVWIEECSEIKFSAFMELLGRIRTPGLTLHFILSCNPVGRESWVYRYFFLRVDNSGKETKVCDEYELYERGSIVKKIDKKQEVLYIHSTMDDNPFLPQSYRDRIEGLKYTDVARWLVARWGRFGANGWRVLPNFTVAKNSKVFKEAVYNCSSQFHFFGLDFGFEESYNALISCCVDEKNMILYIYDEVYINHVTDDIFAEREDVRKTQERVTKHGSIIIGDSAEPKSIKYYRLKGFKIKGCKKYAGSRLQNTKKMKRFKQIVCSPNCPNTIRELKDLTYAKDSRGNVIYDEFTIDPHTFKVDVLGVYKSLEKRERLRCSPERKYQVVTAWYTCNA